MKIQLLENGFQDPLDLLEKRRQFYNNIDLRIAIAKSGDLWYNIRTKILLTCHKVKYKNKDIPKLNNFNIIRKEIPINELKKILTSISNGALSIDDKKINFWDLNDTDASSKKLSHIEYCSRNSERAKERWGILFPLDVFTQSAYPQFNNTLKKISQQLKCYKKPYMHVYEVVDEALEFQDIHQFQKMDNQNKTIVYILMPNYLTFQSLKLKGNNLDLKICFHQAIDVNNLRLNLIGQGKEVYRRQENFEGIRKQKELPYYIITKKIRLQGKPDLLLYLFESSKEFEGPADERFIQNEEVINPSMIIHEYFDPNFRTLMNWLKGEKGSAGFEISIAILLHFCGFRVEWIGYNQMAQDPPDILAFDLNSNLIVGECTISLPDGKKIGMLAKRARELGDRLKVSAIPVMFLSIDSDASGTTLFQVANQENVNIVTLEHLEELLKRYARREVPKEVIKYIKGITYYGSYR